MPPPRRKRSPLDAVGDAIPIFAVVASCVLLIYGLCVVLYGLFVVAVQNAVAVAALAAVVALAVVFRRPAGLLRAGAALLPNGAGARYAEEWCGEFHDMRSDGATWWARLAFVVGILGRAVPVLAVTLRLSRVRAAD
jgi:hypothetical protein